MNFRDCFQYEDLGGIGDVVYHSVYFKEYNFCEIDGEKCITPLIDIAAIDFDLPTAQTANDLLDSLLDLYFTICPMTSEEADNEILNWCNHHAHPYNTSKLYNHLVPWNDKLGTYDAEAANLATFPVATFKKDLIKFGKHFNFAYALENLGKNSNIAMNLYQTYPDWSEYNYFEKYKKVALKEVGDDDEKVYRRTFYKLVAKDYTNLLQILIKDFKPQSIQLELNYASMKAYHVLTINSVFDIVWFLFSKMISEDARDVEFMDSEYYDDFENYDCDNMNSFAGLVRCLGCGKYISSTRNRKYCKKPECQAIRNRKKSSDCTRRKKEKKQ